MPRKKTASVVCSPVVEESNAGDPDHRRNGNAPLGPGARGRLKVLLDLALAIGQREGLLQPSAGESDKEIT